MKVAYIAQSNDASSFYRMQGVLPYIQGIAFADLSHQPTDWSGIIGCDILIIQRPYLAEHAFIIKQAKCMGVKVICDYDDLLTDVPVHNPAYDIYHVNQEYVLSCITLADEIWVSTSALADEFHFFNENIHVIPNAHNDYLFPVEKKRPFNYENKTVFYRGGKTHVIDLLGSVDLIGHTATLNPEWNFFLLGEVDNHVLAHKMKDLNNVTLISPVPLISYFNLLHEINPAIMICPLEDTLFNRCKSNIAWLEGTYAGAAVFGNNNLPEFKECYNISDIGDLITHKYDLQIANNANWLFIENNLLLSGINLLRKERLLA